MRFYHTYTLKISGEMNLREYSESDAENAINEFPKNLAELLKDEMECDFNGLEITVTEVTP